MRNLLSQPDIGLTKALEIAARAISTALPLSPAHERELPFAVRDLSRLLTQDRALLAQSYWTSKRLLGAYARYFLPWNLLRFAWLLPGLDLPLKEEDRLLDLGSGPLTFPIALWLAKPALRDKRLKIICCDTAIGPMQMGKDIFDALAPGSPWEIELRRGPIHRLLPECRSQFALVSAANVLNEQKSSRGVPLEVQLGRIARDVSRKLAPGGRFLSIEPGTRLGGKLIALLRSAAFAARLVPEAPCTHFGNCPMLEKSSTGWCHFSLNTEAAPKSLLKLSRLAGLEKSGLSLSTLLLRQATEQELAAARSFLPQESDDEWDDDEIEQDWEVLEEDSEAEAWRKAFAAADKKNSQAERGIIRILSDHIRLPMEQEPARYACSGRGLVLARNARVIPSGAAVTVRWPQEESFDQKSGALLLELVFKTARQTGEGKSQGKPVQQKEKRRKADSGADSGRQEDHKEKQKAFPREKERSREQAPRRKAEGEARSPREKQAVHEAFSSERRGKGSASPSRGKNGSTGQAKSKAHVPDRKKKKAAS